MIHSETLKQFTEDELAILYYIFYDTLKIEGFNVQRTHVQMLRVDIVCRFLDKYRNNALEINYKIFDSLKEKLLANK
jgi:hypothetical protein